MSRMTIQTICRTIVILQKTFQNWIKDFEPFKQGLAEAIKGVDRYVGHKLKTVIKSDVETAASLLSHTNPNIRLGAAKPAWERHESTAKRSEERELSCSWNNEWICCIRVVLPVHGRQRSSKPRSGSMSGESLHERYK